MSGIPADHWTNLPGVASMAQSMRELAAARDEWRALARELAGSECRCYWRWEGYPPAQRRITCGACRVRELREKEERDAR